MKISEISTPTTDPQKLHVDAMKKVADTAKKNARVAAASVQATKAQEKLRQARQTQVT